MFRLRQTFGAAVVCISSKAAGFLRLMTLMLARGSTTVAFRSSICTALDDIQGSGRGGGSYCCFAWRLESYLVPENFWSMVAKTIFGVAMECLQCLLVSLNVLDRIFTNFKRNLVGMLSREC